jgi:hypothetical protein
MGSCFLKQFLLAFWRLQLVIDEFAEPPEQPCLGMVLIVPS